MIKEQGGNEMTFEAIVQEVRTLPIAQRRILINVLVDSLVEAAEKPKTRRILEFEGVGAHLYDGMDAQEYVNELRREWDNRP
jgi:hypothetical protein